MANRRSHSPPPEDENRPFRSRRDEDDQRRPRTATGHRGQLEPIDENGMRLIRPQWLGHHLNTLSPALFARPSGWGDDMVLHEEHADHGLDLDSLCAHATHFVRSVLPYLYSEVRGFDETYIDKLQSWTYDPRVMNVSARHPNDPHGAYVVWLPAFPLHAECLERKPNGFDRFWYLTPPHLINQSVRKPKVNPVVYPGPDLLPINKEAQLTTEEHEMVQRRQTYGPIHLPTEPFKTSNWTRDAQYVDPRTRNNHAYSPSTGYARPPPNTQWTVTLSDGPEGKQVKIVMVFTPELTKALKRLASEEGERGRQERALGKGRPEYKPLARALF